MAAGHGAGAGGDEEPLLVVLAPAAPQPVAVMLALGAAELADQALRHHLVKPLPVLLGDENPGKTRQGRGVRSGAKAAVAQSSGPSRTWKGKVRAAPAPHVLSASILPGAAKAGSGVTRDAGDAVHISCPIPCTALGREVGPLHSQAGASHPLGDAAAAGTRTGTVMLQARGHRWENALSQVTSPLPGRSCSASSPVAFVPPARTPGTERRVGSRERGGCLCSPL